MVARHAPAVAAPASSTDAPRAQRVIGNVRIVTYQTAERVNRYAAKSRSSHGCWGLKEKTSDSLSVSPKYQGVLDWLAAHP